MSKWFTFSLQICTEHILSVRQFSLKMKQWPYREILYPFKAFILVDTDRQINNSVRKIVCQKVVSTTRKNKARKTNGSCVGSCHGLWVIVSWFLVLSRQIVAGKGDLGMEVLPETCSVLISFSFLSLVRWRLRNRLQERL